MNSPSLSAAARWGLGAVVLLGVVYALWLGRAIFVPMTIALLLVAVLWPMASWVNTTVTMPGFLAKGKFPWISFHLVKRQLPWGITCLIVITVLVLVIVLVPLGFGLAVSKMLNDVPRTYDQQQEAYTKFRDRMIQVAPVMDDETVLPTESGDFRLLQGVRSALDPTNPAFTATVLSVLGLGGNWLIEGVLIMFMLLFLLLEGRLFMKRVVEVFGPSGDAQGKAVKVLDNMAEQVRVYLVWRTIVNFGLALVLGFVYWLMGLKYPVHWALLTAFLCYIPYLGQIVAGFPPVIDAIIFGHTPYLGVAVLLVYVIIMVIEGYVIVPLVMGRSLQLNAITVLLACSFWFLVWGTPGLFLAMPLMAAVKAICANVPGWEVWANLMSTVDPEPRPPEPEPPPAAPGPNYLMDTEVMTPEEAQAHRAALEALERERNK